jgi:hypothetical protein
MMSEKPNVIPGDLERGGHEWIYHSYDNGNKHQWYRAMTNEEIEDVTDGRFENIADIDIEVLWNVTSYPVYMVELSRQSDNEWVVDGNRTFFGPPRPGITDRLGGEWVAECESLTEAVSKVRELTEKL